METIELNGHIIEVQEVHEDLPLVRFKLVRNWCKLVKPNDKLDFPILSVVMFPKSDTQYTTLY